jgi:hypothetical protein
MGADAIDKTALEMVYSCLDIPVKIKNALRKNSYLSALQRGNGIG